MLPPLCGAAGALAPLCGAREPPLDGIAYGPPMNAPLSPSIARRSVPRPAFMGLPGGKGLASYRFSGRCSCCCTGDRLACAALRSDESLGSARKTFTLYGPSCTHKALLKSCKVRMVSVQSTLKKTRV